MEYRGHQKPSQDEVRSKLSTDGIEFLLAQFVDIHGAAKVKQVPVLAFDDVVEEGAGFAGGAVWGLGQGPHSHDMMARADIGTYQQLPWRRNTAVFNCNIYVDDEPYLYCARTNLIRMMNDFYEKGYVLNSGLEPEHFLVERNPDGSIRVWDPMGIDTLSKPCYDFKGLSQNIDYLQDIIRFGNQMGFDIYQSDHEDGNGQWEVNFGWTNMVRAADRYTLFKMMASQVAAKYGFIATFMGKPFADKTGSGGHMHFHVADAKTGENLFPARKGEKDWKGIGYSKLAYHFIGGVLKHIRALTAVGSPTVNCYHRIQSGEFVYSSTSGYTWTPAFACYGDNNRTQLLRGPAPNRFEDRSISAAVNPYLMGAAYIAAGLDGIENEVDPGDPIPGINVWNLSFEERRKRGMQLLPQNLGEAIDALAEDEVVQSGLGAIAEEYIKLKRAEWGEFMRVVHPWEIKRYLTLV